MRSRLFLLALSAVLVAARLFAQTPVPAVSLDFRAVGEDGKPVADLKPADVTLKVNGKPRDVKALRLVQLAGGAASGAPQAVGMEVPMAPPFATNAAADVSRTLFVLLVDELIPAGKEVQVREALEQLLSSLTPRDRVGLLTLPSSRTSVAPSRDLSAVRAAVASLTGKASVAQTDREIACVSLQALQAVQASFAAIPPDSPTTVVLLAPGLTPVGATAARRSSSSTTSSGTDCSVATTDYQAVAAAASAAHASFYVVHLPEALSGKTSDAQATLSSGLESFASAANGVLIKYTGKGEGLMARLANETSAYYVASFEPESNERNGSAARVELHVTRDKVRVFARPDVVIPKASGAPNVKDMTRVGSAFRDLPLRAAAFPSLGADGKVNVVALFEPTEPGTKLTTAMIAMYDEKGKLTAQWTALPADLQAPQPLAGTLAAAPGTYRLRVAATDATGRAGAVDYDLRAELMPAGPAKLSGLLLGVAGAQGFAPRLQFTGSDQAAIGYLEVFGLPAAAVVTGVYELANTTGGAAVATGQANITKGPDRILITGGFNISSLAPGDYTIRAIVNLDGRPIGRAVRTLRKIGS